MRTLAELMSMKGRRALITGATGHIGRVIALALGELGADLILVDTPGSDYGPLSKDLARFTLGDIIKIDCDLEQQVERSRLIQFVLEERAGLDVLVNNAAFVGTSALDGWVTSFEQQSVDTWRRAVEVNLTAAFDIVKGLAPALRDGRTGSVINIASIYAMLGPDHSLYDGTAMGSPAAYAASKGGLVQLTRWLATTLAPEVRVNAISPGGVFRNQPEAFVRRYEARTPLGRMATEDDFKGAVAYLASDLSAYVTGVNLVVDGGWSTW